MSIANPPPNFPPLDSDDPDDPKLNIQRGLEYIDERYGHLNTTGGRAEDYMAGGKVGSDTRDRHHERGSLYRVDQPTGAPIPESLANSTTVRRAGEVIGFAFIVLVFAALAVFLAEILIKTSVFIWSGM